MYFDKELETIQTWIKSTTGLNSWKLSEAKPKLPRPVILFETPNRSKAKDVGRYSYVTAVRQYGKLFVNSVDESISVQEKLLRDIEDKCNLLKVDSAEKCYLKAIRVNFETTESLDIPFSIAYEVAYSRTKPVDPPPATVVKTRSSIVFKTQ